MKVLNYRGRDPWFSDWVVRWLVNALALLIISYIPYGEHRLVMIAGLGSALLAPLLLGIANALIRPVLIILSLPIQLLTLGLFTFVINALMLLLVSGLMGSAFDVPGFWAAVLASILLTLISSAITALIRPDR